MSQLEVNTSVKSPIQQVKSRRYFQLFCLVGAFIATAVCFTVFWQDNQGNTKGMALRRNDASSGASPGQMIAITSSESRFSTRQRVDLEHVVTDDVPRAFLGGATELDNAGMKFLGLSEEKAEEFTIALTSAQQGMTNLALSKIVENPNWQDEVDMNSLCFVIQPGAVKLEPDLAREKIVASYKIPEMKAEGDEVENELRSALMEITTKYADTVVEEARQASEFLDFGKSDINMLLVKHDGASSYSVYIEHRVPKTGEFKGGELIPFAAFNKRFGKLFDVSDDFFDPH